MALSEKRKKAILASWKTGEYSLGELAIKHKIGKSTVKRLTDAVPKGATAHIVEAAHVMQTAESDIKTDKNRTINATDVQAAIQVAKKRTQRIEMADTIIDVGMKSTLKAAAKVNKDLDRTAISAKELNTHQRTIKMATETARLAVSEETPQVIINNTNQQHQEQEQEQEQTQEQVATTEETLAAFGLL